MIKTKVKCVKLWRT